MEIDKKLYGDIKEYCKLNGLKTAEYVNSLLKNAFMLDKYGVSPFSKERTVIEHDAFKEAVNNEVKRILNDPKEFEEAAKKFNKGFFDEMKEYDKTEIMERSNPEPVSADEIIDGDDEVAAETTNDATHGSTEVQIQQNVEKKDDISDKTDIRQPKRRTINVK